MDFDGAEPGTTNEESENLRRRPRSPNIDIILTLPGSIKKPSNSIVL